MEEVSAGAVSADHKQAIRDRLRQIRDLFRFSRYRLTPKGARTSIRTSVSVGGEPDEDPRPRPNEAEPVGRCAVAERATSTRCSSMDDGEPAEAVNPDNDPERRSGSSVEDGTRQPPFLEDRAAKFLVEQNLLQINADFRGFTDMVDRWGRQYGDVPGAREAVEDVGARVVRAGADRDGARRARAQGQPAWTSRTSRTRSRKRRSPLR